MTARRRPAVGVATALAHSLSLEMTFVGEEALEDALEAADGRFEIIQHVMGVGDRGCARVSGAVVCLWRRSVLRCRKDTSSGLLPWWKQQACRFRSCFEIVFRSCSMS